MSDGASDPDKQHAAQDAEAQRAHDRADKAIVAMFPATMSFAVEALKAPALINGGSAAAMLAFIGTGRQAVTSDTILGLRLFAFGLLSAALATGASWASQHFYLASGKKAVRAQARPYVVENAPLRRWGNTARLLAVILVLAAYALAGVAMWTVSSSIVPTPAASTSAPTLPK
jgi:hypothetical protein